MFYHFKQGAMILLVQLHSYVGQDSWGWPEVAAMILLVQLHS